MDSPSVERRRSWSLTSFGIVILLLVVIGPLVVVALYQQVENSRRLSTTEKMRPLGSDLLSYADAHGGLLPLGTMQGADLPPAERMSWQVPLTNVQVDPDLPWKAPDNLRALQTLSSHIERFKPPTFQPTRTDLPLPATPYIGMAGIGPDAPSYPAGNPLAGVFGYDRPVRLDDITDGISNTIAVVTTTLDNGPWAQGGSATVRGLNPRMRPYFGPGRQFGGLFADGGYAVFMDGSIHFLINDIDPRVFEALTTYAGGEQIEGDFLSPRAKVVAALSAE